MHVLAVPETLAGERLDRAVALLTGWSRAEVQVLVDAGEIHVAGRSVPKSHRLVAGDVVEVMSGPQPPGPAGPEPVPVEVRYHDDDVVVVVKPAGLVVHPGAGHAHGTLVQGLLARFPELAEVGDPARPGIVHRLDRDTSGLLVVARSNRAFDALIAQLGQRTVGRRYLALGGGLPAAARGVIDAPIGRSVRRRTRMAVREAGKEARTVYEVRDAYPDRGVALVECRLETGRTHQIRVHLAAIGHPVVGDAAYGGRRPPIAIARPFLHAWSLEFTHPGTGERVRFEDPLPQDLAAVLESLGTPAVPDRPERGADDSA